MKTTELQPPKAPEDAKRRRVLATVDAVEWGEVTIVKAQGKILEIRETKRERFSA